MKKFLWKLVPGPVKRALLKKAIKRWLDQNNIKEENMPAFLKAIFSSKKAQVVFIGLVTVLLRDAIGLDPETVKMIVELLASYLFAQGAVDAVLAYKGYKTK